MKRRLFSLVLALLLPLVGISLTSCHSSVPTTAIQNGVETVALVNGKDFYVIQNKRFQKTFLRGVNLGATKPGFFPGQLGISKSDYLRWFEYIHDLHANVIRVYTTMQPIFYEALKDFNETHSNPLYLMQGVWLNEESIKALQDPYENNNQIMNEFIQDGKNLVDIFHGNSILPERLGFASGEYRVDVSAYVIGWILGIEWSPDFVLQTNQMHANQTHYEGNVVFTKYATPFEAFLAQVADEILTYEIDEYHMTRPLSFTNWLTTDPLTHDNEPDPKEDLVSVNVEHIRLRPTAFAGQFASYHIYPYYPEFMNYQPEYINQRFDGETNPYRAYLRHLKSIHSMPVLVAEYGVPSSRGKAHDAIHSGYHQGQHNEQEQGAILVSLLQDIVEEQYMGAMIFAFQDEWFKRTWNTMDYDLEWRRPFWSNVETNEQMFGLLSFDPGDEWAVHLDANKDDWMDTIPIIDDNGYRLSMQQDERYLYVLAEHSTRDLFSEGIWVALDTIPNQGNQRSVEWNLDFSHDADFLMYVRQDSGQLLVDPYYDPFQYVYGTQLGLIPEQTISEQKNSGYFHAIHHALSAELVLPRTQAIVPFSSYEAGSLSPGISDPNHPLFDSLADYWFGEGFVEIRIPWLLLNIMDPSSKVVMSDFHSSGQIQGESMDSIHIGIGYPGETMAMAAYSYEGWTTPHYHERLKKSYYVVQEAFGDLSDGTVND